MRVQGSTQQRLSALAAQLKRLRESLAVLDEQVAYLEEQAEEASTRAVVASTPLADRVHRDAVEDLRRTRRERDRAAAEIAELLAEQDRLLERLL